MNIPTWKELRESLGDGLSEEALEIVRRATAQQRHNARVKAARQAALDTVPDPRLAGVLCMLEANGHGGPLEMGDHLGIRATLRAEWARGLGSGRANARDGTAWDAAIRAAAREMLEEVAPTAQDVVDLLDRITDPVVLEEARAYARSRIYEAARNGHDPAPAVREWDQVICAVSQRIVPVNAEAPMEDHSPQGPQLKWEAVPEAHPDAINEVSILEMRDYMANMLLRDTDSKSEI